MLRIIDRPAPASSISCSITAPNSAPVVLHDEGEWRSAECLRTDPAPAVGARWATDGATECHAASIPGRVVVSVFLRAVRAALSVNGRVVHDGWVPCGSVLVTLPGQAASAMFQGPAETIQLYLGVDFLKEQGGEDASLLIDAVGVLPLVRDEPIEKLVRALVIGHESGCTAGCTEKMARPIAVRVSLLHRAMDQHVARQKVKFPLWRVKKVQDYVEAHLTDTITLADIAAAAGLSPMHFAAQFRAATGHRPHEFVQLHRVEKAKALLSQTAAPMIDIATEVGFRNQSHFATVFKRYAGQTPSDWRDQRLSR